MKVRFNVPVEFDGKCNAIGVGTNGTTKHTPGPLTLFAQRVGFGTNTRPVVACANHKAQYLRATEVYKLITDAVQIEDPAPLLKTVHVKSSTGRTRTLVVRRAVSGQPVWYVQSDSGSEYLVQFRRGIWLCECKHFVARLFARNQVCHHIAGVREADPEAQAIESGAEPRLRY